MDWFFDWKGWGWAGWGALGVLASIAIAVWPKGKGRSEPPASAGAASTASVFTIRDYQQGLEAREDQIRQDLGRAHGAEKELLAQERDAIADKLSNVEGAYQEMLGRLEEARATILSLSRGPREEAGPDKAAAEALRQGMARAGEAMAPALEAAHRRGGAEEDGIDWSDPRTRADFDKAYGLEPKNPDYLYGAGITAAALGDLVGAEGLHRRVLALMEGRSPPWPYLTEALEGFAGLLLERGADEEAEPIYRRLLEIQEEALGPTNPALAQNLNALAVLLHGRGELEEAEGLYRLALALLEKAYGPEDVQLERVLENLAALLQEKGQDDEVEEILRRCVAITGRGGPEAEESYAHADNLRRLADLLARRSGEEGGAKAEEAGFLYRRALAVAGRIFGPEAAEAQEIRAELDRFTSRRR